MNEKIKNLFNSIVVAIEVNENNEFMLYTIINGDQLITKVSCSKYAKFLINDFKALENKYGLSVYTFDPPKVKALFSISEQYGWFTRKELIEFLEKELSNGG